MGPSDFARAEQEILDELAQLAAATLTPRHYDLGELTDVELSFATELGVSTPGG